MNEAPKRIVAVLDDAGCGECFVNEGPIYEYETPYIRADLVDGLVEALEQLLDDMGDSGLSVCPAAKEQAQAALKALEEE